MRTHQILIIFYLYENDTLDGIGILPDFLHSALKQLQSKGYVDDKNSLTDDGKEAMWHVVNSL